MGVAEGGRQTNKTTFVVPKYKLRSIDMIFIQNHGRTRNEGASAPKTCELVMGIW
jgi:hypothetical protein